jgi:hypothetical protein
MEDAGCKRDWGDILLGFNISRYYKGLFLYRAAIPHSSILNLLLDYIDK